MTKNIKELTIGGGVIIPKGVKSLGDNVVFEEDVRGDVYNINQTDNMVAVDTSQYYKMLNYKMSELKTG